MRYPSDTSIISKGLAVTERCDALIIPADSPPSGATLKKAVLFFDSVTLANPADRALVNDREVVEHFDNTTVSWSSRNDFPRSPDYLDVMGRLLADTSTLQSRGIVRLTSAEPLPTLDAAMNYTVWHSAITSVVLANCLNQMVLPLSYFHPLFGENDESRHADYAD
jgi:hypothetical protein